MKGAIRTISYSSRKHWKGEKAQGLQSIGKEVFKCTAPASTSISWYNPVKCSPGKPWESSEGNATRMQAFGSRGSNGFQSSDREDNGVQQEEWGWEMQGYEWRGDLSTEQAGLLFLPKTTPYCPLVAKAQANGIQWLLLRKDNVSSRNYFKAISNCSHTWERAPWTRASDNNRHRFCIMRILPTKAQAHCMLGRENPNHSLGRGRGWFWTR